MQPPQVSAQAVTVNDDRHEPGAARRVAVTLEQCWHRVPGGTATAALEVLRAWGPLRARWVPVGVSARHSSPPEPAYRPSVPVEQLPLPRLALYESWHRLRRPALARATGAVTVIHATGLAMPPATVPVVWTVHDLAFLRSPERFTRNGLRFFHAALERARRDAALVLCPSAATREDCAAAGFDQRRLRVVPLGVRPVPVTDDEVRTVRAAFGLTGAYVLFVGTLEPRKNLSSLLEAFAALRDPTLTLAVVGPRGWGELPSAGGLSAERVRFTGFVTEAQKAALYRGAAALCYPSLWEGFGLPVLEAMAQGCPVVTSAGTATEEAAGGAALLVDPHDPATITAALGRVLAEPDLARELRRRGRERAGVCTWGRTAALVADAYDEVVS